MYRSTEQLYGKIFSDAEKKQKRRISYEDQVNETRSESDAQAKKDAKNINEKEGRGTLKGIFNKEKKPISSTELLHEEAKKEDELREKIKKNQTRSIMVGDKTDEEKMRAVRKDIQKMLPGNFVEKLSDLKRLRTTDRSTYQSFVTQIFIQANGGEDVWGRKSWPRPDFRHWTAEDCMELLRDLGEDLSLKQLEELKKGNK